MKFIKTRWSRYWLSWFWSGRFWYVTAVKHSKNERLRKSTPIGGGETRDEAFKEFVLLMSQIQLEKDSTNA